MIKRFINVYVYFEDYETSLEKMEEVLTDLGLEFEYINDGTESTGTLI